jgi:hypothetical protein
MTHRAAARYAAIAITAAAVSGVVVHQADRPERSQSPPAAPALTSPSASDVRSACQIVADTMQRANAEVAEKNANADLSQLAHPYHLQDVWDSAHQADLERAVTQLGHAAEVDPHWTLVSVALQASAAASVVNEGGGPFTLIALSSAETACTEALNDSRSRVG